MNDDQLRDLLKSRDPAASLPPTDPDRVTRLLEDAMSHDVDAPTHDLSHQKADPRRRTPLTWLVAAAAVLVIAGVGAFAILGGGQGDQPSPRAVDPAPHASDEAVTVTELSAGPEVQGRCAIVTAERLAFQQRAFEGTVTSVDGTVVTLEVEHWYRGGDSDVVQVRGPSDNMVALLSAVSFETGGRYLVTATDDVVSVCGYSAPYSDELAALYADAFGS